MQTSKIVLVAATALVSAFAGVLQARDTDAQIKAREALEKKLSDGQSQPAAVTNVTPAPAPTAKPKAAPKPSVAPVPGPSTVGGRPTPPGATVIHPAATHAPESAPKTVSTPHSISAPQSVDSGSAPVLPMPPAADPAAIEKARDALHQKMNQSQPASATAPATAPQVQAPKKSKPAVVAQPQPKPAEVRPVEPAPLPKPVAQPATPPSAPAPVAKASEPSSEPVLPPPGDSAEITKARDALRQKMNQSTGEIGSAPAPAPKIQTTPAKQAKTTPEPKQPVFHSAAGTEQKTIASTQPQSQPTPKPNTPQRAKAEDAAKHAAEKKPTPPPPSKPAQVNANTGKGATVFTPLNAPALPISADKQRRLSDLLTKYQADQLTPEQYHQQRAKILAEP